VNQRALEPKLGLDVKHLHGQFLSRGIASGLGTGRVASDRSMIRSGINGKNAWKGNGPLASPGEKGKGDWQPVERRQASSNSPAGRGVFREDFAK